MATAASDSTPTSSSPTILPPPRPTQMPLPPPPPLTRLRWPCSGAAAGRAGAVCRTSSWWRPSPAPPGNRPRQPSHPTRWLR